MNKKGFVLIETIIVLLVVVVCMLALYKAYSFVFLNLKQNNYYDNINDIYKVNIVKKIFNFESIGEGENFHKEEIGACDLCMNYDCGVLLEEENLNINNVIYIRNINSFLNNPQGATNTDIDYIKTLDSTKAYLIIHYENNNKQHYASLPVEDLGGV